MAYVGYPTGSPQAPQSGVPGGAMVPYGQGPAGLTATNLTGAGQQAQQNPGLFENLMNMLASPGVGRVSRYAPGGVMAANLFAQGDIAGGVGSTAATVAAGKLLKNPRLAAAIPNPIARAAVMAGTSLAAAGGGQLLGRAGGGILNGLGQIGNQLIGGSQAAVNDVTGAIAGQQREQGVSAFSGKEAGLGGITDKETLQRMALLNELGVNLPTRALENQYQIQQKYKNADMNRQMQLNQQNAQLVGQLNRQMGTMQLAGMGLQESSQTARTIMTANPYEASVLNTGSVRGL